MNYIELFTQIVPRPIKSAEEKARLLAEVDKLMDIPEDELTEDQGDFLLLLTILIQDYEKDSLKAFKATADNYNDAIKAFEHTKKKYNNALKMLADN